MVDGRHGELRTRDQSTVDAVEVVSIYGCYWARGRSRSRGARFGKAHSRLLPGAGLFPASSQKKKTLQHGEHDEEFHEYNDGLQSVSSHLSYFCGTLRENRITLGVHSSVCAAADWYQS